MPKLLIADDDDALCTNLAEWLKLEHYTYDVVHTGSTAIEYLQQFEYDGVILDWEMPGMPGVDVCKTYRDRGGAAAIVILTGRDAVADKEAGLDAGADDYVTKPFHFKELSARLRAVLRRPRQIAVEAITIRELTLVPARRSLHRGSEEIRLQNLEYVVLEFLARNPNQYFTPNELLNRLWEADASVSQDAIYSCIKRLRKKIDTGDNSDKPLITSAYGQGYRLEP